MGSALPFAGVGSGFRERVQPDLDETNPAGPRTCRRRQSLQHVLNFHRFDY